MDFDRSMTTLPVGVYDDIASMRRRHGFDQHDPAFRLRNGIMHFPLRHNFDGGPHHGIASGDTDDFAVLRFFRFLWNLWPRHP